MSPTDSHLQHIVTAVIVAHDGAAWLPRLIAALGAQTRPVQRVVAVDTGSRDRSGSMLAAQLGQGAVFGMDRSTGYAAAVRRAVQHRAASTAVPGSGGRGRGGELEWLWLLHDDCEPAPDALEKLLRGAGEMPRTAVVGPKLRDWTDRRTLIEAGLTLDTAGRRITGVEPREVDQGQLDGHRNTLAVGSAGMLVRRDVWERLGGFDPGMALFGEDIDFCWRVHEAGLRVRLITDAVVYHARAATRGRRVISVGRRGRRLDRRNGLLTLLVNLPFGPMVAALVGNVALSLGRTLYCLVAKRPVAALDEAAAVLGVVGHPLRLARARARRAHGRRAAYSLVRAELPPGRSIRRLAELAAVSVARPTPDNLAGAHHAGADVADDDSLLVDSGFIQRVLTRPGVLLMLALIVVTAVAERRILTTGTLGGGALLPAREGASGLWSQFLQAYHPVGAGSASAGPPYVGALAVLSTVLLGKVWLAVDVLLLGCVPLAGLTAYLALARVTGSVSVRVWAAASYALLPIAFGAISAGRLGSAVAFVLVPVIGLLAGRMVTEPARLARRAAWATGFTAAVGAAFVPLLWPLAVAGAGLAALLVLRRGTAMLVNLIIVAGTPLVLLLPWLPHLVTHPSAVLLEVGIQQPGLASGDLPASSLIMLSPGGPGLPPSWASAALLVVGLAALLVTRRMAVVAVGWGVALLGFTAALLASRVTVTSASGQPVTAWPGVALAVAALGLLVAAAAAADGMPPVRGLVRRAARGEPRSLAGVVLSLVACTAPVIAAGWWLVNGVGGPVGSASGEVVPSLVANAASAGRQLRTLVLSSSGGHVSYLLMRETNPEFSSADITEVPAAQAALGKAVASLVAPGGTGVTSQSQQLADFDIGFVLMRPPSDAGLASVLDGVPGLTQVSKTSAFDLWRLTNLPSRVSVVEPNGTVAAVASGPVGVSGSAVPAAGGTLLLAEPAGGWSAAVNGHGLTPVPSPAGSWAQAFRLPRGGGTLTLQRNGLWHDVVLVLQMLMFVVVAGLALPGVRTAGEVAATGPQTSAKAAEPGERSPVKDVGRSGSGRRPVAGRPAGAGVGTAGDVTEVFAAPAADTGRRQSRSAPRSQPRLSRLASLARAGSPPASRYPDSGPRSSDARRSERPRSGPNAREGYASDHGTAARGYPAGRDYPPAAGYDHGRASSPGSGYPAESPYPPEPAGPQRSSLGEVGGRRARRDERRQASGWPRGYREQGRQQDSAPQASSWPEEDVSGRTPGRSREIEPDGPGTRYRARRASRRRDPEGGEERR